MNESGRCRHARRSQSSVLGSVAHAFGTSLPGWLVVVPTRHVVALHDLSTTEAAQLGEIVTQVSQALHVVIDCVKTYSACFAEAEGFAHLHAHVIPRMEWFTAEQRGPNVFGLLGVSADEELPEAERDRLALALRAAMVDADLETL